MRASVLCHYAGQSAAVALCMYQALKKGMLHSGQSVQWTRNRIGSVGENKKTIGKADIFFSWGLFQSHGGFVIQVIK